MIDIDTRFPDGLGQSPPVEVRRHDIVAEPLEAGRYDLIHMRYLLMHLPERERAIEHLVDALRPSGWLLVEDGDFYDYQISYPPVAALTATGTAIVRLLERAGADPRYGLKHKKAGKTHVCFPNRCQIHPEMALQAV